MSLVFFFPIPETILIDCAIVQGFDMQMQLDLDEAFLLYGC